jgi:hypothetical protein
MKKFDALVEGLRGLGQSKRYILLIYVVNLIIAVAIGVGMSNTIENSLGNSARSENMLEGFDDLWNRNFANDSDGIASTFDPTVTGIGAIFKSLDSFLQGKILGGGSAAGGQASNADISIVAIGLIYLTMWTFFSGGLISFYAAKHERPSFFRESARFFPRLLMLGIMAGVIYIAMFRYGFSWLTETVDELTRETLDERVHFTYTILKYLAFWLVLWTVNMVFDYAKILTVIQDPVNVLGTPLRAAGVVFGHFFKTYGLYLLIGGLWVVMMLFYWLVAPGAGQSSWTAILGAFLIGQLYIVTRIGTRCLFYSSQTAMFNALTSDTRQPGTTAPESTQMTEQHL